MGKKLVASLLLIAFAVTVGAYYVLNFKSGTLTKGEENVKFAVYYGPVNSTVVDYLNHFDIVVLDPSQVNTSVLSRIEAVKLAYIDLGEMTGHVVGDCRSPELEVIGYDTLWNQSIVNVSSHAWVDYIKCQVSTAMSMGFKGVMFDDLDVAEQYNFTAPGMIEVLSWTRQNFPDAVVAINRGFYVLPHVCKYVDYVLVEDFGSKVVKAGELTEVSPDEVIKDVELVRSCGLKPLGLSYAYEPHDSLYSYSADLARELKVPLFVTNWNVTALWPQP
ncbi:MAG: hypothetical protein ACP5HQ_00950 [Thermoprotei archaeon]